MTVAEHERAARQERARAEAAAAGARVAARGAEWERYEVRRHTGLANEHAAAARKLLEQVQAACPSGPHQFPAALASLHVRAVESIQDADVAVSRRSGRRFHSERLQGVRLVLADPVASPEEIRNALRCAGIQALAGMATPGSASSPFAVRGAKASLLLSGDRSSVDIRANDADAALEILARAQALPISASKVP